MLKKQSPASIACSAPAEVTNYIAGLPEPARSRIEAMRTIIGAATPPEAVECISYSMPAFRYHGALVCYAAFHKHYSLFPMNAQLIADLKDELAKYKTSKGTIQFPMETSPPAGLIKKIVKIRAAQNEKRR